MTHPRSSSRLPGVPATRPSRTAALRHRDAGMTTAEYAVGTLAACGFGGVLFKVLTSAGVAAQLAALVRRALTVGF